MVRWRDTDGAIEHRASLPLYYRIKQNGDGDEGETDDRGTVPGVGLGLGTPKLGGTVRQEGDVNYSVVVTVQKEEWKKMKQQKC